MVFFLGGAEMKRGVISLPKKLLSINDGKRLRTGESLSIVDLNYFALYWDELVVPASRLLYLALPEEKSFIDSGFLKRPDIPMLGGYFNSSDVVSMHANSLDYFLNVKRKKEKDSHWSLNIIGNESYNGDCESEIKDSFRLELSKAIPVPDASVNVNDILEFKMKRQPELAALHQYLDELYLEVVSSGDFNLSRAKAFHKLSNTLSDLDKLNNEGWRSPIKFDTSALFEANNGDLMSGASALYSIWEANQGNLTGAITAGVAAVIGQGFARLKPSIQSVRRKPGNTIAYLSSAHKESILKKS